MQFSYPAKLTLDKVDGGFVVTRRGLPEVITLSETLNEAMDKAAGQFSPHLNVVYSTSD